MEYSRKVKQILTEFPTKEEIKAVYDSPGGTGLERENLWTRQVRHVS